MTDLAITIRTATPSDANRVGQLAHEFANYLRSLGDTSDFKFNAQAYLRDGFGSRPAFFGIVAEVKGRIVGYLLYHPGYDTDQAMRLLHVIDLYVEEGFRGRGAGRRLMEEAAARGRREGARGLTWTVYSANEGAAEFYKRIGARYVKGLDLMYLEVDSK